MDGKAEGRKRHWISRFGWATKLNRGRDERADFQCGVNYLCELIDGCNTSRYLARKVEITSSSNRWQYGQARLNNISLGYSS
jgi:hypothetical protein